MRPQWNEAIFSQVLLSPWFVSTYVPSRSLFFAIVGYLAGIVVLVRLWQRRRMTRRTLALACCGWILCAAAAGYLFFSRGGQSPDGVLLAATVMEDAGDGYVEAQSNLALFSTQRREYSLAFGRGWVDAMPLAAPASAQAAAQSAGVSAWRGRDARATAARGLGLQAFARPSRGTVAAHRRHRAAGRRSLLLKVRNQSGKDLIDCWLVAPGTRIALGDLPSGESWTKTFPLSAAGSDRARGGSKRACARSSSTTSPAMPCFTLRSFPRTARKRPGAAARRSFSAG